MSESLEKLKKVNPEAAAKISESGTQLIWTRSHIAVFSALKFPVRLLKYT